MESTSEPLPVYYVLGSAVEVELLAAIVYYAWSWPKARRNASMG